MFFNTQIFAGIRKGSHGAKTLALPGGHLEMYESWKDCAKREVLEETGLHIHNIEMVHVSNDIMTTEQKHYITIFMKAECVNSDQEIQNLEPHKCEGWNSFSWDDLFTISKSDKNDDIKLFIPLQNMVLGKLET